MPVDKRICDNCKDVVEEECHIIFYCTMYTMNEFYQYVDNFYDLSSMSNSEKLKLFMTEETDTLLCIIY